MQTGEVVRTVKVKPWDKSQGEFVEINEGDFDPAIHKALSDAECAKLIIDAAQPDPDAVIAGPESEAAPEPVAEAPKPAAKAPAKKPAKRKGK